ncbi:hypothetical protein WICPIJ_004804 [Wickerhamomyces pijperi]|uniref:Uncharacterized protein n=1 Tax=Wickerhamomyces pijperi TaxID=599730 RepID=A0A9P8Q5A3_WICPI|nr:hypothetical protein WICPIJ_004804 [Wickerhamomyces pijperi]
MSFKSKHKLLQLIRQSEPPFVPLFELELVLVLVLVLPSLDSDSESDEPPDLVLDESLLESEPDLELLDEEEEEDDDDELSPE